MTNKEFCCDKETAKRGIKKVLMVIGFVILGVAVCILLGFVVMWLWNWLMPMIFSLTEITYWQAVGIFVLAKIFFGGIGGGSSDDSGSHRKKRGPKGVIRREIKAEFEKEFDKEFDKEYDKEVSKHESSSEGSTEDYDELYEKWWTQKGEDSFKEYMNNTKDSEK